ncbi:MAG: hypothetical protein WDW38_005722 [Sanguina aurantia]
MEPRIQRLEYKLAAVNNLAGKLLAVEELAAEMGVAIPELEFPSPDTQSSLGSSEPIWPSRGLPKPGSHLEPPGEAAPSCGGKADASPRASRAGSGARPASQGQGVDAASADASHIEPPDGFTRRQMPGSELATPMDRGGGAGGAREGRASERRSGGGNRPGADGKMAQMMVQLKEGRQENTDLKATLDALKEEVDRLGDKLSEAQASLVANAAGASQASGVLTEHCTKLSQETAALRKEGHRVPEVSFADFCRLQSQVAAAQAEVVGNASLVHSLRDKELPAIALQLANVKEVAKHDGAPRDTDTLFHSRLTALEVATNDLQAALKLLNGGLEGMVHMDHLASLEEDLVGKASALDLKILASRTQALIASYGGLAEAVATNAGADASTGEMMSSGPLLSKFRCLTCDQPTTGGPSGAPSPASRGAFLPRLDAMPQRDPSGLNTSAADPRRSGARAGSPPRPRSGDMVEYLNAHHALAGGDGRRPSPNRRGAVGGGLVNPAAASGRVVVTTTTPGKQLTSGAGRTPVFI